MCGIFGYSGKTKSQIDKIKILGLYNIERGEDATGFLSVNNKNDSFSYDRKLVNIKRYIEFYQKESDDLNRDLIIGHVRKKTVGFNTLTNAHPFVYDKLSGVHNGTLKEYHFLLNNYKERFKKLGKTKELEFLESVDVKNASDSRIIYALLNVVDEMEILESYCGAAAFVYTDVHKQLRVYRNSERPLFFGKVKDGMYFSSIRDSLLAINIQNKDITNVEVDVLYTIFQGEIVSKEKVKRSPLVPVVEEDDEKEGKGNTNVGDIFNKTHKQLAVEILSSKDFVRKKSNLRLLIDSKRNNVPIVRSKTLKSRIHVQDNKTYTISNYANGTVSKECDIRTDLDNVKNSFIFYNMSYKMYVLMVICHNGSFYQYQITDYWAVIHLKEEMGQKTIDFSKANIIGPNQKSLILGPGKDQFINNDVETLNTETDYKEVFVLDMAGKFINVKLKDDNVDLETVDEVTVIPIEVNLTTAEIKTSVDNLYSPEEYLDLIEDLYEGTIVDNSDALSKIEAIEKFKDILAGYPTAELIKMLKIVIRETTNVNIMERRSVLLNLLSSSEKFTVESLSKAFNKTKEITPNETTNA